MKYYKAKYLFFILPIITIILSLAFWLNTESVETNTNQNVPYIKYNDKIIKVEVADEFEEWRQGLSDRESLPAGQGLLFIFPQSQERSFWMKNMRFPIDIVWLLDNEIVKIHTNLPPEGNEPKNYYYPGTRINRVLEINAGYADELGLKVGERVEYRLQ